MKQLLSRKDMKGKMAERLMYEELCMEQKPDFTADPAYLDLIERLIRALIKEKSFGFLYQYKNVILEAYTRQRKYKRHWSLVNKFPQKQEKVRFSELFCADFPKSICFICFKAEYIITVAIDI